MIDRTFPLNALPAFEAASRHGSFKAAAAELSLTPSAISHQIKQLESALGVSLFRRLPRGLELTAAGVRYAQTVRALLARLGEESDGLVGRGPRTQLRFAMPQFVAQSVALPQLAGFRAAHPEIELSITTGMAVADLEGGEADVAVRMGPGSWPGLSAHKLADCYGSVVATRELAGRAEALSATDGLPTVCLSSLREHTRKLVAAAGLSAGASGMLFLDSYVSVVEAIRQGLGVGVLYGPTPEPLGLPEGLVHLAPRPFQAPFGMYFVWRTRDSHRAEIQAARRWADAFDQHTWLL